MCLYASLRGSQGGLREFIGSGVKRTILIESNLHFLICKVGMSGCLGEIPTGGE